MARYKVRITVYKDKAGNTLAGPTAMGFAGDILLALGVLFLLVFLMSVVKGPYLLLFRLVEGVVCLAAGLLLRRAAPQKAQELYDKSDS